MKYNLLFLLLILISCKSKQDRAIERLSNGKDTLVKKPSYLRWKTFQNKNPDLLVFIQIIKDENAQIIQRRTIDENGRLVQLLLEYPLIEYKYDSSGNIISIDKRDINHQLTSQMGEAATVKYQYDRNNNLVKIEYLDENGNYFYKSNQTSIVQHYYDKNNRLIQTKYLNNKQNPKGKASIINMYYDSLNRVTLEKVYDYIKGQSQLFYYKEFTYNPTDTIEKRKNPNGSLIKHLKRTKEAVYVITKKTDSTTTYYISEKHK